jgi:subtilisin family serine protease
VYFAKFGDKMMRKQLTVYITLVTLLVGLIGVSSCSTTPAPLPATVIPTNTQTETAISTPIPPLSNKSEGPILPDSSYVTTIVRAPIAWRKSTGQGVKVAVIQNHQENLDLVNLVAPGAKVVPLQADKQFKIDGKFPDQVLKDQNIRLLVILQSLDFESQALRQALQALISANVTVFVNADLTSNDDSITLINDLEAAGAVTVGLLSVDGAVIGRSLSMRKINLYAPTGWSAQTAKAALTVAGVGALLVASDPAISAEKIKGQLIATADRMWQASDPSTGKWMMQNVRVDPDTGDYTPNSSAFTFNRVNAANALGQTLDLPWPVNALNAPAAWKKATGRGVKVAVIDQGFHINNPAFQGHLIDKAAFVPNKNFNGVQNFHGTSMSKIVLSVAPDAYLMFLLLDESGSSVTTAAEVKAIDYAIASHVDVITNSNGPWSNTPEVHAAIDRAIDAGIVFVWFHYQGTNPAVIRPGYYWISTYDVGAFDRFFDPDKPSDLEGGLSDTSPQIAGIAALVLQNEPNLSPMEVKKRIFETAAILPNGCNLADAAAAVENRPSGRKIPEQPINSQVRGQAKVIYSLPGEVEKRILVINNAGTKTILPVLPQRNVFLYRYSTNQSGDRPTDLLIASTEDQLISLGFYFEGTLVSGEIKPMNFNLILEKRTRLGVEFSSDGVQPIQMLVNGKNISFHWSNLDGIPLMKMDNQTGKYSISSGVILYQFDAEGDFLPLVNIFQSIY